MLCGILVLRIASEVREGLPVEIPGPSPASGAPVPSTRHSQSDREAILARNLFDTSALVPPEPVAPVEEEVEPTELPLGLLGTSASPRDDLSWAAVWDAESQERLVVQEGDPVANGLATVARIERGRVLFSEDGEIRELELDGDDEYRPPKRSHSKKRRASKQRNHKRRARR